MEIYVQERERSVAPISKRKKWYLGASGAFTSFILLYILVALHYRNVFFPAAAVNGIDVSRLTPLQAQELLNADAAGYILTIVGDDGKSDQISGSGIGLYVKDDNTLQNIVDNQNIFTWAFQGFQKKEYFLDIEYDEEKLFSAVESLSCMDKENWISPENAYITYEKGTGYQIVPEVAGNEILTDSFLEAVQAAVERLDSTISLREAGIYKSPEILADDAVLAEHFAVLQPYSDMSVIYQFGDQTEILDSDTLADWISLDESGNLLIDEEKAGEFVKGLAKKYNTAYAPKKLKTSYGETITIKGGFYGWRIDRKAEVEALLEVIRAGKSVTREPVYQLRAAVHDKIDYGDTYVEINLTAQHLFFYKDGKLLIETDFVSGNASNGNDTPPGSFAITYTERDATLRGEDYTTPVSYWMPFNGNIGMHDSKWRSKYGGDIYQTNGSHGCINLPPAAAKVIFENIKKGDPVLCYRTEEPAQDPSAAPEDQGNAPAVPETPSSDTPASDAQPSQPDNGAPTDIPVAPGDSLPVNGTPADTPVAPESNLPVNDTPAETAPATQ